MPAIYPVTTSRVSDLLLQRRFLSQFEFDRSQLLKIQDRLSTGYRISAPSDDPPAARRAITLQRLLAHKDQAKINLQLSQSYVGASDNALSGVSQLVTNIRAESLTVLNTTTIDAQRQAVAEEVQRAIAQLVDVGNQRFRGRHLFAGSNTGEQPFERFEKYVVYHGNEGAIESFVDIDFLSQTNVHGNEVFGALSPEVRGTADLNPIITLDTKLTDLRGGLGVTKGTFSLHDGFTKSIVDIATAETVGDVARLIEQNPPAGRQVVVRLSANGLVLDLDDAGGGNLTVLEVPGGSTARELGILEKNGVGTAPLAGQDLNPRLLPTTRLADILGTRATALLQFPGANNDLIIEATQNGPQLNNVQVQFFDTTAGDTAIATYDDVTKVLRLDINANVTSANTLLQAINTSGVFTAQFDDKLEPNNDGSGFVDIINPPVTTAGGSGIVLDRDSGIQVVNAEQTFTITFEDAETIEDLLNTLNTSDAHLLAEINADGTGIDVRSRLSGADFQIGENGGTTATELGLRSFNLSTSLADLNHGRGVDTVAGTDLVIQRKDGVLLDVDLSNAATIGDVIDAINNHTLNTGNVVQARLAELGNGLEIYDENDAGASTLTVTRNTSFAVWDLGLVPKGSDQATASPATAATALLQFPPPNDQNTAILLTANQTGFALDDVAVEFQDTQTGDVALATFDPVGKRLTIQIDATQTTANTVIAEIANLPGMEFTAALDLTTDPTNNGTGILAATGVVATTDGGLPELLRGTDVNPLETEGVFNSLLRLNDAILDFDLPEIERTLAMLDDDLNRLNFARAEVGARARDLEVFEERLDSEKVELQSALSEEIDADLVEAVSDLAARQANLEATLRLIGRTMQLTVLDFL